jgi:hypothetical protein
MSKMLVRVSGRLATALTRARQQHKDYLTDAEDQETIGNIVRQHGVCGVMCDV